MFRSQAPFCWRRGLAPSRSCNALRLGNGAAPPLQSTRLALIRKGPRSSPKLSHTQKAPEKGKKDSKKIDLLAGIEPRTPPLWQAMRHQQDHRARRLPAGANLSCQPLYRLGNPWHWPLHRFGHAGCADQATSSAWQEAWERAWKGHALPYPARSGQQCPHVRLLFLRRLEDRPLLTSSRFSLPAILTQTSILHGPISTV